MEAFLGRSEAAKCGISWRDLFAIGWTGKPCPKWQMSGCPVQQRLHLPPAYGIWRQYSAATFWASRLQHQLDCNRIWNYERMMIRADAPQRTTAPHGGYRPNKLDKRGILRIALRRDRCFHPRLVRWAGAASLCRNLTRMATMDAGHWPGIQGPRNFINAQV